MPDPSSIYCLHTNSQRHRQEDPNVMPSLSMMCKRYISASTTGCAFTLLAALIFGTTAMTSLPPHHPSPPATSFHLPLVAFGSAAMVGTCSFGHSCQAPTFCVANVDTCGCDPSSNFDASCLSRKQVDDICPQVDFLGRCYDDRYCWRYPNDPNGPYSLCCPTLNGAPCTNNGACFGWGTVTPYCKCRRGFGGRACRPPTHTVEMPPTATQHITLTRTLRITSTKSKLIPATRTLIPVPTATRTLRKSRGQTSSDTLKHTLTLRITHTKTKTMRHTHSVTLTLSKSLRVTPSATVHRVACTFPTLTSSEEAVRAAMANISAFQLASRPSSAMARRMRRFITTTADRSYSVGYCGLAAAFIALLCLHLYASAWAIVGSDSIIKEAAAEEAAAGQNAVTRTIKRMKKEQKRKAKEDKAAEAALTKDLDKRFSRAANNGSVVGSRAAVVPAASSLTYEQLIALDQQFNQQQQSRNHRTASFPAAAPSVASRGSRKPLGGGGGGNSGNNHQRAPYPTAVPSYPAAAAASPYGSTPLTTAQHSPTRDDEMLAMHQQQQQQQQHRFDGGNGAAMGGGGGFDPSVSVRQE